MTPRRRDFTNARSNAKRRALPWGLTFEQWAHIWSISGKYAERGRERGQYQMDRINPARGYELGNIQIISGALNRTKDSPHGHNAVLTEKAVAAIRDKFIPRVVTMQDLAAAYGVSKACIKAVLRRQNWAGV